MSSTVLFTSWAAPEWLAIAVPGIVIDLAARRDTLQAAAIGHYLWPIIPWIFISGLVGARRVLHRWPMAIRWLAVSLFLITAADSPLWRILISRPWQNLAAAAHVREQLSALPSGASILAQPNLIPHLAHGNNIDVLGSDAAPIRTARYAAICFLGDEWPFTSDTLRDIDDHFRRDPEFHVALVSGPLTLFERGPARK